MACIDAALSTQEDGYLKLLGAANRYERNGDSLLIYAVGADKPLRFTGQMASQP